ncbi:MAG: Endoribonuclease L-PSP [Candidatus Roizmanbacteria bacterium GW2011_GWC1_37_12]|nr:MAG: Endoribonuclease L-PSP [Candidatus Roizmanbacteria bacterium GW2011_GWC1_37_12]
MDKLKEVTPKAQGPYSQTVKANGFIFCAGQIGINPVTNIVVEGIENQTHRVLKNLQLVLQEAGSNLDKVVKTTIFLVNMADLVKVNEIYASYFKKNKPARATVGVNSLPKGVLIEIDAVATF